jgi:hypothetical protein
MSKSNRFLSNSNSNKKSADNSNSTNNSRFSILNESDEPKVNSQNERGSNALFNNKTNNNSRFESLKDEPSPVSVSDNGSIRSNSMNDRSDRSYSDRSYSDRSYSDRSYSNRGNSFKAATPVKKAEPVIQQLNLKESDFPDMLSVGIIKKEEMPSKWAAIVKKEVVVEVKESEEDKLPYVEPGWICIRKNPKTGKTETIQGPLTDEQKKYERLKYLERYDFKYNLYKTIERMSARWDEYKEQFDERYGQGAYNKKYGVNEIYYDDDDGAYESDYDSEYEYVYE